MLTVGTMNNVLLIGAAAVSPSRQLLHHHHHHHYHYHCYGAAPFFHHNRLIAGTSTAVPLYNHNRSIPQLNRHNRKILFLLFSSLGSEREAAAATNTGTSCDNNETTTSITIPPQLEEWSDTPILVRPLRQRIPVLHYDDQWIVVNKPAGITVHPDRQCQYHARGGHTKFLTSTLRKQLRRKIYPVHRLDHRTSGAMVLSFDGTITPMLQEALTNSNKMYIALVRGNWDTLFPTSTTITINQPIAYNNGQLKEAVTVFRKLAVYCTTPTKDMDGMYPYCCTLIMAEPQTGRTHQIRRHAARHLHMPILGDSEHGDSKVNRYWRQEIKLQRLALHCLAVQNLNRPNNNDGCSNSSSGGGGGDDDDDDSDTGANMSSTTMNVIAPLPDDLGMILRSMQPMWDEAVSIEPRLSSQWIDVRNGTLGIQQPWQKNQIVTTITTNK